MKTKIKTTECIHSVPCSKVFAPLTFGALALVVHFNPGSALTLGGRAGGSQLAHAPVLRPVRAAHLVVPVFAHAHAQLALLLQLLLVLLLRLNALEPGAAPCHHGPAAPARLPGPRGAQLAAAARVHHPERAARRQQRGARAQITGPAGARRARDRSGGERREDQTPQHHGGPERVRTVAARILASTGE